MTAFPRQGLGGVGVEEWDVQDGLAHNTDIFSFPIREKGMQFGKDMIIYPLNAVDDSGPYTFIIPGEGSEYMYFPLMRLNGIFSVRAEDGTALNEADVSIINLAPAGLFSQLEVTCNNTLVTTSTHKNFPYKVYMTEQLSFGEGAKNTHLRLHGYLDDTNEKSGETNYADHKALATRRGWIINSRQMDFNIPLHAGLLHSSRIFPPNVEIKIELS